MDTIRLGRTGLAVSRIAFGTWQLGGDWGRFDESAAVAAIHRARELGGTSSTPRRPTGSAHPSGCWAPRCAAS